MIATDYIDGICDSPSGPTHVQDSTQSRSSGRSAHRPAESLYRGAFEHSELSLPVQFIENAETAPLGVFITPGFSWYFRHNRKLPRGLRFSVRFRIPDRSAGGGMCTEFMVSIMRRSFTGFRCRVLKAMKDYSTTDCESSSNRNCSWVISTGLTRCSSNPASRALSRSADCPNPVSATRKIPEQSGR